MRKLRLSSCWVAMVLFPQTLHLEVGVRGQIVREFFHDCRLKEEVLNWNMYTYAYITCTHMHILKYCIFNLMKIHGHTRS